MFGVLCVLFGVLCVLFGVIGILFGVICVLFGATFFYFLGTNPTWAHKSDVLFGSSLMIMPCSTKSSSNCFAWALICIGIDLGLNLYKEGSNLQERACFNLIFIGGQHRKLEGFRVSLNRDL